MKTHLERLIIGWAAGAATAIVAAAWDIGFPYQALLAGIVGFCATISIYWWE